MASRRRPRSTSGCTRRRSSCTRQRFWPASCARRLPMTPCSTRSPRRSAATRCSQQMLQQKMISPLAFATAVSTALIPYGHKVALPPASRGVAAVLHAVRRAPAGRALRSGAHVRRRAQGLHDDRPDDAEEGASGAQQHPQAEGPGRGDGGDRSAHRTGQGARRRARLLEAALRHRDAGRSVSRARPSSRSSSRRHSSRASSLPRRFSPGHR